MVGRLLYLIDPDDEPVASRALTMFMPSASATSPNTTCRPFSHDVTTVVMKNCEPLLLPQVTLGTSVLVRMKISIQLTCSGQR
jgi:hypothetical protein